MLKLDSIEKSEYNLILDDILVILNLPESEKNGIIQRKEPIVKKIENILNENKKNINIIKYLVGEIDGSLYKNYAKDFGNDFDLALIAIKASSENFNYLSNSFKLDERISYELVKTQIREGKNYFEIKKFIETNFKDRKKELLDFYKLKINDVKIVLNDDLTKNLINIDEKYPDFIKLLKDKNIIIGDKKKITINEKFLNEFQTVFKKKIDIKGKNEQEIKKLKLNFLIDFIGIKNENLNEEILFILNSIIDLIVINEDKQEQIKDEKNELNEENEDETTDSKDSKDVSKKHINKDQETKDDIFEKKLNYSLPNSTFTFSSNGNYSIKSSGEKDLEITQDESQKMTSLALKNYYKFYQKLCKLGLNFLWDKHKTEFLIVMNNSFQVDYLYGEGISEGKTLSILNLIGRNIGIPEKEVIGDDGKPTKEVKCFYTLEAADLMFEDIKKTKKINGKKWSEDSMFSKGPIENKLKETGLIDSKKQVLNISRWK